MSPGFNTLPWAARVTASEAGAPGGKPPHTFDSNIYDPKWARHGFYGIMLGSRMAGLISVSGLQCGWDRMIAPPNHDLACMRMLVNIYIYAMMQGG